MNLQIDTHTRAPAPASHRRAEPATGHRRAGPATGHPAPWRATLVRWHAALTTGETRWAREDGQATAEYGLVVVAAAGIAAALIAFGKSGFERFFEKVVDTIVKRV